MGRADIGGVATRQKWSRPSFRLPDCGKEEVKPARDGSVSCESAPFHGAQEKLLSYGGKRRIIYLLCDFEKQEALL